MPDRPKLCFHNPSSLVLTLTTSQVFAALHFGMPWPNDDALYTKLPEDPATPFTDFHIYELQWEKETMRW